jgi:hypothetical protein
MIPSNSTRDYLLGVKHKIIVNDVSGDIKKHNYFVRCEGLSVRVIDTTDGKDILNMDLWELAENEDILCVIHRLSGDLHIIGITRSYTKELSDISDSYWKRGAGFDGEFRTVFSLGTPVYSYLFLCYRKRIEVIGQFNFCENLLMVDVINVNDQSENSYAFKEYWRYLIRIPEVKKLYSSEACIHAMQEITPNKELPAAIWFEGGVVILPQESLQALEKLSVKFGDTTVRGNIKIYGFNGNLEYEGEGSAIVDYERLFHISHVGKEAEKGLLSLFKHHKDGSIECVANEKGLTEENCTQLRLIANQV